MTSARPGKIDIKRAIFMSIGIVLFCVVYLAPGFPDAVDPAVGVTGLVKVGETVEAGRPLLVLQANDEERLSEARTMVEQAVTLSGTPVTPPVRVLETIQPGTGGS